MMIDAKDTEGTGDGLSDENISHHSRLFLAAGSETTSNVINFSCIVTLVDGILNDKTFKREKVP
jgi:cytochrome P450